MKYLELQDHAHQHLAMMGGMSMEDRLHLIRLMEKMLTTDWEQVAKAARPVLNIVAGG